MIKNNTEKIENNKVFKNKKILNPLKTPKEIVGRKKQKNKLINILKGINEDYIPPTVSIFGPPGTGKTVTTRKICSSFAQKNKDLEITYVNLKESRTVFRGANKILDSLAGEKKKAYHGLDGIFEEIWDVLDGYPEWTVVILDEVDKINQDKNYDTDNLFYRLLRGEEKISRDINTSLFLINNKLQHIDFDLDSRVDSVMSEEQIFFPPYNKRELNNILDPIIDKAFRKDVISDEVREYGISRVSETWGDARRALDLFRRAGDITIYQNSDSIKKEIIDDCIDSSGKSVLIEKFTSLPLQHYLILVSVSILCRKKEFGTTEEICDIYKRLISEKNSVSRRYIRNILNSLETMGLIETWIENRGRYGNIKQIKTTFDPIWIKDSYKPYIENSEHMKLENFKEELKVNVFRDVY